MLRVTALSDLVAVKEDLYYDCQLQEYLETEKNHKRLNEYFVIQTAKNFTRLIFQELNASGSHLIFGIPGIGKTHYAVVLANLLGNDFDTEPLQSFMARLQASDAKLTDIIKENRRKRFLTLVLDGITEEESFKLKFMSFLHGALYREKVDFMPNQDLALPEILKGTAEALQKTGMFQGLAVIIDKADSYLKNNPSELKEFADFCRRSSFPCQLMVFSNLNYQELSGLEGQIFDQLHYFTLTTAAFDLEELLHRAFLKRPEAQDFTGLSKEKDLKTALELLGKYKLYPGKGQDWLKDTPVLGCYPFHPFALFAMVRLAEKLGDDKRNFRNFFIDNLPGTLANFVQNLALYQPNGRLSMYTMDYLYSYYKSNLHNQEEYKPLLKVLEKIQPLTADLAFSGRILSLLALLHIIRHPFLPATGELIADALQLIPREYEKVKDTLDALVRKDALIFDETTREFSLNLAKPEIDIEAALAAEKEKLRLSWDIPAFFKRLSPDFKFTPQSFNLAHHTDKAAERLFITAQKLLDPQFKLDPEAVLYRSGAYKADLLVVYPFTFNQEEYQQLKQKVEKGAYRNPHLLIALPNSLFSLLNDAVEMEALRRTLSFYMPFCEPFYPGREKWEARFQQLQQNLHTMMQDYIKADNFTWHYQDKFFKLQPGEEPELVSKIYAEIFSQLPDLNIPALSYQHPSPEAAKLEKDILELLLGAKDEIILSLDHPVAAEAGISSLLVTNGWLKEIARGSFWVKYVPCLPKEDTPLYAVWKQMSQKLAGNERGVKLTYLEDFYGTFAKPPFGLSRATITVLLAYFLIKYRWQLSLYSKVAPNSEEPAGTLEPATAQALVNLEKNPNGWALYFTEYSPQDRELLLEILKIFAPEVKLDYKTLLWDEAVEALQSWEHNLIPLCKFEAPNKSAYTNSFLAWLSQEEAYLNPQSFIKEQLLQALQYDTGNFDWETGLEELKHRLKAVYDEVGVSDRLFKENILNQVMKIFNASDIKALQTNLNQWQAALPKTSKTTPPDDDARIFLEILSTGSPLREIFLSELPEALGLGGVEKWESDVQQNYLERLKYIKLNLEIGFFKGTYLVWKDKPVMITRIRQRAVIMLQELGFKPEEIQELLETMLENTTT